MSTTLDELKEMVSSFWPSYRVSVYPMWRTKLCQYDVAEIRAALTQQRATDPDGMKPVWKSIYATLGGGTDGQSSLLASIVGGVRRDHEKRGTKGIQYWTDEQCFLNYLDAQSRPILFDAEGRPKPDEDSRRAQLAVFARETAARGIANDFQEHGQPLPDWLERLCAT